MKKSHLLKATCLLVLASPIMLKATDYYVSPNGNNTLTGTSISSAWQTLDKVNSINLLPGDRIFLEGNNIFSGQLYFDSDDGNDSLNVISVSSYGNGRAIVNSGDSYGLYAYNTQGVHISDLIFMGSGMNSNTSDGVIFYTDLAGDIKLNNFSVKNIEVLNYGGNGITFGSWNGLTGFKNFTIDGVNVHDVKKNGIESYGFYSQNYSEWAHENVIVKNSIVHDVPGYSSSSHKGSGIVLGQVNSGLIEHCKAYNNGTNNDACGGPGGIWVWDCNKIIIQYCESYENKTQSHCDGFGFDFDGGVQNSIMQYNYSHDNDGAGILLGQFSYARGWFNNIIRYNVSENDGRKNSGGISLFTAPGTSVKTAYIYNNTIITPFSAFNNELAVFNFIQWGNQFDSIFVFNNIFKTTGGTPLIDAPQGYEAFFAGNLYWTVEDSFHIIFQGVSYSSLELWQNATQNEVWDSNYVGTYANPLFLNPQSVNFSDVEKFQLSSNSPAIDAGIDLRGLPFADHLQHDFLNNTVPQHNLFDVGAFEYTDESSKMEEGPIDAINAINEVNEVVIFPNPATSFDKIMIKGEDNISQIRVFTLMGAVVLDVSNINTNEYELSGIEKGSYIVQIVNRNNTILSKKLVVLH